MIFRSPAVLSVIVPMHDAARALERTLGALEASALPRELWELIIVDDASGDDSAAVAARHADTVVRLRDQRRGPAYARNRGVEVATGEYLAFVDADVCVGPTTLRTMLQTLRDDPTLAAVSAVYDVGPAGMGLVTTYRNVLAHLLQQLEARTQHFSTACGMVRREAFLHAGMFDEWRFPRAQIEDIEFGYRLRVLGHRLCLRPDLQVTHLKRWKLGPALVSDMRDRAVPWMRVLGRRAIDGGQGAAWYTTASPARTLLMTATLVLGVAGATARDAQLLATAGLLLLVALLLNARILAKFARARGFAFAMAAAPLHLLFELFNGIALGTGWLVYHLVGDPRPNPTIEAFAEVGVQTWPPVPTRCAVESVTASTRQN